MDTEIQNQVHLHVGIIFYEDFNKEQGSFKASTDVEVIAESVEKAVEKAKELVKGTGSLKNKKFYVRTVVEHHPHKEQH